MTYQSQNNIEFTDGFSVSRNLLDERLQNTAGEGSANSLLLGEGYYRPIKPLAEKGSGTGSRIMRQVGSTWGGLKDIGALRASGTLHEDIARTLWFIGSGQVHVEGNDIAGATASSLLQVLVSVNGSYTDPASGAFDVGLPQPSAPQVATLDTIGNISGAVSFKLERRRPATGDRGRASSTSAILTPTTGHKVRVTFPLASVGQTHWRVYATFQGFGGVGIHYAVPYNGSLDILETDVAAGVVDGTARSIEIDYRDGDLFPEEASFDDYPPPAGTHALRLENVKIVLGAYADSTASPTSTNTGTAGAVSKPNFYGSYIPNHLVFFPEQIVDVLSRPTDSYAYVACQNSIHALQYVGYRGEELPAVTVTTILPDVGIQNPNNWCQFRGRLAIYTAEGNLLVMDGDGEILDDIDAPIQRFIKDWLPDTTVLAYDSKNDCLTISNGNVTLAYCLKNGKWSLPTYWKDLGNTGTVLSAITSQRILRFSMEHPTEVNAAEYDNGAGNVPSYFVSAWQTAPSKTVAKNIYELAASAENDVANSEVVMVLQKNLRTIALRDIGVTNGSATVQSATANFDASWVGRKIVIFGNGITANNRFIGKIDSVTDGQNVVVSSETNVPFAPLITGTNLLAFFGMKVMTRTLGGRTGGQHLENFFPNVIDLRSYAIATCITGQEVGQLNEITVFGTQKETSRVSAL